MGNYKFRLSDMMPNAWFYKLRDMSLTTSTARNNPNSKKKPTKSTKTYSQKSHNSSSHPNQPRQPYYYSSDFSTVSKTTSLDEPPRRSASKQSRRGTRRKTVYKPSPRRTPPSSADHHHCSCHNHHHHQHDLDFVKSPVSSEFESDVFDYVNHDESQNGQASRSSSCSCGFSSSVTDIIIDVESRSYGFDAMLEMDLPPILTKPAHQQQTKTVSLSPVQKSSVQKDRDGETVSVSGSIPKETAGRKSASSGIKLRAKSNSPKIQPNSSRRKSISRRSKSEAQKKAGFSESFAIVKASVDPEKDFRESMMEMIVENNIRASKDLEELLACYLSLNSDEYHGLIIKAFEQIWFNLPDLKS